MKKIMSAIVATLVAVAFTGIAFAAEPAPAPEQAQPAIRAEVTPAKPEMRKHHKKHHRKHHKKHHKAHMKKHEEQAPVAPAEPTPPPAQ
jgi:hypothetical protein